MKIAIIGCGKQAPKHIKGFRNLARIHAIAVADPVHERARAFATQHGAAIYPDPGLPFDDEDVSAIVICTPTATHMPLIRRAIESGKHVLCEKPGGSGGASEAIELEVEARQAGSVVRIGYLYRFAAAIAASRRMMLGAETDGISRILGTIRSARFRIGGQGSLAHWKHLSAQGGGAINEMISHMVDLALWMFGPARDCEVVVKNRVFDRRVIEGVEQAVDAEDYIVARLQTRSGVQVTLEGDFLSTRFWQQIEIRGDNGILVASIEPSFDSFCRLERPNGAFPSGVQRLRSREHDLYAMQAKDFLDAIADGASPHVGCDLGEAAQGRAILDALRDAPFSRKSEPPPESERPWRAP